MIVNDILEIPIPVKNGKIIKLKISSLSGDSLFLMEGNDADESEAPCQIVEGKYYDYSIDEGYFLKDSNGIISSNKFNPSFGLISPNIYVGTLTLDVYCKGEEESCGVVKLEVQSRKTDYRSDYRKMLSDITEHCIELIFQHSSPITQMVQPEYESENKTWHQRFAFIKSIVETDEFNDAVNKVISAPVTKWEEGQANIDIRNVRRLNNNAIRQIASATNRFNLPDGHPLVSKQLKSIPSKIRITNKIETIDTPENRFVKHALQSFLFFVSDFKGRIKGENKARHEASKLEGQLERHLSHSIFKVISNPVSILLNSPVLQRKEGYREILKAWLMFNLAAKLTWKGGDDVYDIGKRNVAVLYEYWLFFELLKIVEKVFGIKPGKDLIIDTKDNLGLQLKQGEHFPIKGICDKYNRKLEVQLSYNRTFSGSKTESNYPNGGSWTRSMRPDYSLSIWPYGINEDEAEKEELIVHIHFDAKYKIENIADVVGDVENLDKEKENLDKEKEEQSKGTYKRADLLKMHSYKDAIRRTGGAYILYPGKEKATYNKMGFRELIPGLGAFQIRPSKNQDNGSKELEKFFEDVVAHFINRASQREKFAFRTYDIHKTVPKKEDEVKGVLPETFKENRSLLPDETFVLIGYYKSEGHLEWIIENNLYNVRYGNKYNLTDEMVSAKYLLLYTENNFNSELFFKIRAGGPRIFSKVEMSLELKYPTTPSQDNYLIYNLEKEPENEFKAVKWDLSEFKEFEDFSKKKLPFTISLKDLMRIIKK